MSVNVTTEQNFESLKIKINGLLFICLKRSQLLGFQSWKQNGKYLIEFYLSGNSSILTEYDKGDLWEAILQELDKDYIF